MSPLEEAEVIFADAMGAPAAQHDAEIMELLVRALKIVRCIVRRPAKDLWELNERDRRDALKLCDLTDELAEKMQKYRLQ